MPSQPGRTAGKTQSKRRTRGHQLATALWRQAKLLRTAAGKKDDDGLEPLYGSQLADKAAKVLPSDPWIVCVNHVSEPKRNHVESKHQVQYQDKSSWLANNLDIVQIDIVSSCQAI